MPRRQEKGTPILGIPLYFPVCLFSKTKSLDQCAVSLDIFLSEISEESSPLSNHLQKSSS